MSQERSQAWRRFQAKTHKHRGMGSDKSEWKSDKRWKFLYTRSEKIKRAKQLGFEYPRKNMLTLLAEM